MKQSPSGAATEATRDGPRERCSVAPGSHSSLERSGFEPWATLVSA